MRLLFYFTVLTFTACTQSKVKVIADTFENGRPKIVWYFNSKADSKEKIAISLKDGKGTVDKPLSFEEQGFYANGNLEFKGQYLLGQTSGCWEYFYETGINEARAYYVNGKNTDTVICWYPSGKLKRNIIEIDTMKNYWHNIDYYENGQKHIECYQTLDSLNKFMINGEFKEWYDNGFPKFTAFFKDGRTIGVWKEYETDGKLKEESEKSISISIK